MGFGKYRQGFGFFVLIASLFVFWWLGTSLNIHIPALQDKLGSFPGLISAFLYVLAYVIVTFFLFFSKDVFWIAGAFLFGPFLSALYICIAEIINAYILFYLSRFLGRAYVKESLSKKYKNLDYKLGRISFFWLFIFRAAPVIPYRFMDMASGLTGMSFRKYLAAVIFGTPLKMFWIQYIIANIGVNIFKDPNLIVQFFLNNRIFLLFSLTYIILILAVIYKLRFFKEKYGS
ncbi:MAG: VTT domain-containing protein [Candidatus Omnitrophica bacterium]|nr:VTT domain-containing protein [Candidatus Omnitrophota bacterium]